MLEPRLVPSLARMLLSPAQPCKAWLLSFPPPAITPGLLQGWASSCPIPERPLQSGLVLGTGSHHWQLLQQTKAVELKRARAIKSTHSRWSVQSVSPPPPPPRSSLSSSSLLTPFILVFADLSPRTSQPFPKAGPPPSPVPPAPISTPNGGSERKPEA